MLTPESIPICEVLTDVACLPDNMNCRPGQSGSIVSGKGNSRVAAKGSGRGAARFVAIAAATAAALTVAGGSNNFVAYGADPSKFWCTASNFFCAEICKFRRIFLRFP